MAESPISMSLTVYEPLKSSLDEPLIVPQMEGHNTIPSVIGPMGHHVADLRLLLQVILETRPWQADPRVIRLPWRQEDEESVNQKIHAKDLTFGVLRTDGFVSPHPPVIRAVDEAVAALKAHGYVHRWKYSISRAANSNTATTKSFGCLRLLFECDTLANLIILLSAGTR